MATESKFNGQTTIRMRKKVLNLSINAATKTFGKTVVPNLTRENLLLMLEAGKQLQNPDGMTREELMVYFDISQNDTKKKLRLEQIIQAELKAGKIQLISNQYKLKQ